MKALVPALALAAALLGTPLAEAAHRHGPGCGHRPPAHGYYGHRPSYRSPGGYGYGYGYRAPRPYYRSYRHYAPPPPYYGYGYGGYGGYGYDGGYGYGGYGYYPPPPPRYCPPRPRVGVWFGF
jgi:hypothetical protein